MFFLMTLDDFYSRVKVFFLWNNGESRGYFGIRLWEEVKHDNCRTIKYSVLDFANAVLHGETFQNHMEAERIRFMDFFFFFSMKTCRRN